MFVSLLRPAGEDSVDAEALGEDALGAAIAERRGALVDEVVFTQESDVGKVAGLIERGSHQLFTQGITNLTAFHRLRDSDKGAYETAYGSSSELALNPATFDDENALNPFTVREIREAMNWLVNRRYIAEEIYGGMAVPRVLPLNTAFPDYARLADTARALELRYQHDPERARRVIEEHMEKLGALKRGGRWVYNDTPVTIRVLIRTEDARNQVGDYVANLMEDLGFRVLRQYRTAEEASRIWIAGDPAGGQWNIYTGSWVSTTINRDEATNLSFYYTQRGRPELLWQTYASGDELDEIASRLERRDFTRMAERRDLMARGLELAMASSYRIWLIDQQSIIPRASNVIMAADLAGGIAGSRLWPYTLRYTDRVGGRMVFGSPSVLTEPWNPVAGSNWLFDTMITRPLSDPPLLPDPFTGLYLPQRVARAEVTVQEDAPINKTLDWLTLDRQEEIPVPPEAWIGWNAEEGRFRMVAEDHPEGVNARSKVRIQYEDGFLDRQWQDGSTMSMADLLLPWILTHSRADEKSPFFDPSHVPAFQVYKQHFRGLKIIREEPLIIEVYSDQVLPDAETLVASRALTPLPWHTLSIGMMAEQAGDLAFSSYKSDINRIDWMSLVAGPSLNVLRRHLDRAIDMGFMPYGGVLKDFLGSEDEISQRYQALKQWDSERKHFWVGDGPFYLHSVHPVERTVVLRRNEKFQDPSSKWLDFSRPEIPELTLDGPLMVRTGEAAEFNLAVTFAGEPYPEGAIDNARYLLFDGDGDLVTEGALLPVGAGQWQVTLSSEQIRSLGTGANSLELAVTSTRVALPAFASHAFATVPAGTRTLEELDD
ncbi:MAG: ABC transporter substrate-binding protein [Halomonadaceae bacterium]|nr:MAG: ABC transporter substrate-binding protein [Halomonadaceae bacterium]